MRRRKQAALLTLLAGLGACSSPPASDPVPVPEPVAAPGDPPRTTFHDGSSYWSVIWPRGWETLPDVGPVVRSRGPLSRDAQGSGWGMVRPHGVVLWPDMVLGMIGTTPDTWKDTFIDEKKAIVYEYQDRHGRYLGCAVERGDSLIYVAVGCPKARFEEFRGTLTKVVYSVRCAR